ncbi:hypothetical protein M0D69_07300 [Caballeronia sp. SEWSISQ10-4 2]|uniref:hypothetical protein n=1 Tax=Caballeronia sp. SEWSISQ10-4 2 TaxID=2937438 RepID=UPI0026572588|nr:hypothetical protein [Caballeronia sp. SEWSISQ10-4 2]MDN7177827.1 hypothetical protein [Caballeronia sp. SEWSISQ10-4 2]
MSTKRLRPSGAWEYVIRRKGILPKPLSLTFDTEEEGDIYVRRLEQMLDAGILPEDLVARRSDLVSIDDAIRSYMTKVSLPPSDASLLNALIDRWNGQVLTGVDYQWAETWVKSMKRKDVIAPSTIRHYVGALARCFDWVVQSGTLSLATNPLRLLPKRYAHTRTKTRPLFVHTFPILPTQHGLRCACPFSTCLSPGSAHGDVLPTGRGASGYPPFG